MRRADDPTSPPAHGTAPVALASFGARRASLRADAIERLERTPGQVIVICSKCRAAPARRDGQPFHTDPTWCEPCDEEAAGVDGMFDDA